MGKYDKIKQSCFERNLELPEHGLVIYTFGNVSVSDQQKGVFAIKPSGVPYDKLEPAHMVILDFDNNVVEGDLKPSSDTKTHALLYKTWSEIQGIAHTHSTYAVAWAQAQLDIPILGTTHADHLAVDIPCTPIMSDEMIKGDYEYETGNQIIQCLNERNLSYKEVEMILVSNHGPFSWGKSPEKAVYNSVILEELARMAYLSLKVNPDAPKLKTSLISKHYDRKHGKNAYYGQ